MTFLTFKAARQYIDTLGEIFSISMTPTGNIMVTGVW